MKLILDPTNLDDYRTFLRVKRLPRYRVDGESVEFPDEYADLLGLDRPATALDTGYEPSPFLFDYQRDIVRLALRKRRFAVFADCGLGKTLIYLEYLRAVRKVIPANKCLLIVAPLMVVRQVLADVRQFYGDTFGIEQVAARNLQGWLNGDRRFQVGITNYEAIAEGLQPGDLAGLVPDESSTLKSHYGAWGTRLIDLGAGLEWKLCLTGTPAPNDRIEYANHAVFLGQFPTVNAFLARYFVNRGETQNRWELKPHALRPFYLALSHWSIFLNNPATYGWRDNCGTIPPMYVHVEDVPLTDEQSRLAMESTGTLFATAGGITSRSKLSQLAKGRHKGGQVATNKTAFIRRMVDSWPGESTIIWCRYNHEQEELAAAFPEAANIEGKTPQEVRETLLDEFKSGTRKVLISKPRMLGFGLNLQVATRQVFSGLEDSYEEFYQAVKRSNRVGSTRPLNVHIPVTELERPMIENVLRKARQVQQDTEEQERIFREVAACY